MAHELRASGRIRRAGRKSARLVQVRAAESDDGPNSKSWFRRLFFDSSEAPDSDIADDFEPPEVYIPKKSWFRRFLFERIEVLDSGVADDFELPDEVDFEDRVDAEEPTDEVDAMLEDDGRFSGGR